MRHLRPLLVALCATASPCIFGQSQPSLPYISGVVVDTQGSSTAGAQVTLTLRSGVTPSRIKSDASGRFAFPALQPGTYTLVVAANGFQTLTRSTVESPFADQSLTLVLGIAPAQTTIVVTATRSDRSIADVPASVSVVPSQQLEQTLARTIDDVLRRVPSIDLPIASTNEQHPRTPSFPCEESGLRSLVLLDEVPLGRRLYRAVWRWHCYASIFSTPFILWLSCTGAIYLFRPQIELWLDRPYDHLHVIGSRSSPKQIALAAATAVPHSSVHLYELPPSNDAAVRVVVGAGTEEYRVYVHPVTRAILYVVNEDERPMTLLAHLHGQLLAGRWGSYFTVLAASWAVVLLLTGLYLWWPRQTEELAGVLRVRVGRGQRIFWRDLHAVTDVWISSLALFLILTGLPWANGWGAYVKRWRDITHTSVSKQDRTTSRAGVFADRVAMNKPGLQSPGFMPDMPGMDYSGHMLQPINSPDAYEPLDRLVPVAASLGLAAPVEIMPAMQRPVQHSELPEGCPSGSGQDLWSSFASRMTCVG